MSIYIFKTMLCMALLLLFHLFFLQKEKMHRFNRFYLLCSIIFSFIVPLISIETSLPVPAVKEMIAPEIIYPLNSFSQNNDLTQIAATSSTVVFSRGFIFTVYAAIAFILLCRFTANIARLFFKVKSNTTISYAGAKLVLVKDTLIPHSFMQYIFINKEEFENGKIEAAILLHECTHVKQKHSVDILFIELLSVLMWFNPLLYLYRKAIVLNHEFLADDAVVTTFGNTKDYQYLLIRKSGLAGSVQLANQFNYAVTKKRLVMLLKQRSPIIAMGKQLALLPIVAGAIFIFSNKIVGQDSSKAIVPQTKITPPQKNKPAYDSLGNKTWLGLSPGFTTEGVTGEMLKEYEAIVNKYRTTGEKKWVKLLSELTTADRDRLAAIFKQMNRTQQSDQIVGFVALPPPMAKSVPSAAQLEAFKNAGIYGVWIDENKIENSELNKYENTDFDHVFISKLYPAARKNKSYSYQVNLMTKAGYKKYFEVETANRKNGELHIYIKQVKEIAGR